MAARHFTAMRYGFLSRLITFALFSVLLPGCLATSWIEKSAEGEPKGTGYFALSANVDSYEITRWWTTGLKTCEGQKTISILRHDLPVGCTTARFFLNDVMHELHIAKPMSSNWITATRLPLPDDSYPPCALLVSYGSFSEPSVFEGMVVTSTTGLIAKSERKQPHQAAWALGPAGIAADTYIFLGALVTLPVWGPIGLLADSADTTAKLEQKEEAKSSLPPPVAACWTAIENNVAKEYGPSVPDQLFTGFEWSPSTKNAFVLIDVNEGFSDDNPVKINTRVILHQGRVKFRIMQHYYGSLWTDADVECGLRDGVVIATAVKLRK